MEIAKDYYINIIKESNCIDMDRIKNHKLLYIMATATALAEYVSFEDYNEMVNLRDIYPLMTFDCKGQEAYRLIENLIKYGFNYENILCIGNGNHELINNAISMVEKGKSIVEVNEYLDEKMITKVVVALESLPVRKYIVENKLNTKELDKFYIPTTPLENEIGISNEMVDNEIKLEIRYKRILDMPLYESATFIEQFIGKDLKEINSIAINQVQDGKRKSRDKGLKWGTHLSNMCNLGNVFYKRTNEIHNALRDT